MVDQQRTKERSLRKAIRRLVRAEVDYSWKGDFLASERPFIELELKRAKEALTRAIERALIP